MASDLTDYETFDEEEVEIADEMREELASMGRGGESEGEDHE